MVAVMTWLQAWFQTLKAEAGEKGAVAVEYAVVVGVVVTMVVGFLVAATPGISGAMTAAIQKLIDWIAAH